MNWGSEPGRKPPIFSATSHILSNDEHHVTSRRRAGQRTHSSIILLARSLSSSERKKWNVGWGIPYPSSYSVSNRTSFVSTGSEYPKKRRSTIVRVSIVCATAP